MIVIYLALSGYIGGRDRVDCSRSFWMTSSINRNFSAFRSFYFSMSKKAAKAPKGPSEICQFPDVEMLNVTVTVAWLV